MDVSASEKSNFYNKYIRKMRLEIDDNGILKIKVQELLLQLQELIET